MVGVHRHRAAVAAEVGDDRPPVLRPASRPHEPGDQDPARRVVVDRDQRLAPDRLLSQPWAHRAVSLPQLPQRRTPQTPGAVLRPAAALPQPGPQQSAVSARPRSPRPRSAARRYSVSSVGPKSPHSCSATDGDSARISAGSARFEGRPLRSCTTATSPSASKRRNRRLRWRVVTPNRAAPAGFASTPSLTCVRTKNAVPLPQADLHRLLSRTPFPLASTEDGP